MNGGESNTMGYITDVEGIKVGHAQSLEGMTGCTVIICEEGATGGVDVRGSAPGTRETDLLKSENLVERIHSVVLAGGSAFGLASSNGVMKYLEENGIGLDVGVTKVPIVVSAVIFDLWLGDSKIRPDEKMGYEAAKAATEFNTDRGVVGAGTGASVGKALGPSFAMKSGLGSASIKVGDLVVAALVVVNALGDIYNDGIQIAGPYKDGKLLSTLELMKEGYSSGFANTNTTIGVITTNAILTKAEANKVSQVAHDGMARAINPVHTMMDGDTVFTMATGKVKGDVNLVSQLAAEVFQKAIYDIEFEHSDHL